MERGVTPVRKRETLWLDLGKAGYEPTYRLQLELAERRRAGDIPDVAMVVEHEPCITLGRAARAEHVLVDPEVLESAGVGLHRVDRGGDVTYHGWGQLVCYAIVDLSAYGRDVHAHARRLEEVMIRTVASFGVSAHRDPGLSWGLVSPGQAGSHRVRRAQVGDDARRLSQREPAHAALRSHRAVWDPWGAGDFPRTGGGPEYRVGSCAQ